MSRDLKADLEICNKATPGLWEWKQSPNYTEIVIHNSDGLDAQLAIVRDYKDGRFIACAREGWPEAIERAIKAEEKLSKIREVFKYRRCKNCLHYYNPVCPMDDVVIEDELTDESYCSWFCAKAEQTEKEGER